jgi:glucose-6-phosphate isomerase
MSELEETISGAQELLTRFDPVTGEIAGAQTAKRYLSDLRGCFVDTIAYGAALEAGDPLLYTVATVEFGKEDGDLHYGVGRIMPGRIGFEYYMTKGHLHAWRNAAEIYLGLTGEGVMLLENELSGATRCVPLRPNDIVYVPSHTAHRTINTGMVPLTYLGVYPAKAGYDYTTIAQNNFRKVVLEENGKPVVLDRAPWTQRPQSA